MLNPAFTEPRIRIFAWLNRKFLRGKTDKSLDCSEKLILRDDTSQLRICVFKSKEHSAKVPGILWKNGGGYGMGVPEQGIGMAKAFINKKQCVIIAPDYRLSVDTPYPVALDDCYTTSRWMKKNAESPGINDSQIYIGGDCAGGTAALSLYARDNKEVNIAFLNPLGSAKWYSFDI